MFDFNSIGNLFSGSFQWVNNSMMNTIINSVFLIVILMGTFALAIWWGFLRWKLYPIKVIIEEPTNSGAYLLREDRMRIVQDKTGRREALLLKNKRARVDPAIYKLMEAGVGGIKYAFLRRLNADEYIATRIIRSGGEIDFRPVPAEIRNWAAQEMEDSWKRFEKQLAWWQHPTFQMGMLLIAFVLGILFLLKPIQSAVDSGATIAASNKEVSMNIRDTAQATRDTAQMLDRVMNNNRQSIQQVSPIMPSVPVSLQGETTE